MFMFAFEVFFLLFLAYVTTSCGGKDSDYQDVPPVSTGDAAFDKIQPVLVANCQGCHAAGNAKGLPVFSSGAVLKASKAKAKLEAGAMPPAPKTISSPDKAALLAYLGG